MWGNVLRCRGTEGGEDQGVGKCVEVWGRWGEEWGRCEGRCGERIWACGEVWKDVRGCEERCGKR